MAARSCPCVSVDVPSGLSSDTGHWLGPPLRPERVVTLGLPKLGLSLAEESGAIDVVDIGLPESSIESVPIAQRVWTRPAAAARLPVRAAGAHKGSFGHVLVVAGSEVPAEARAAELGWPGAVPVLSAASLGCYRTCSRFATRKQVSTRNSERWHCWKPAWTPA